MSTRRPAVVNEKLVWDTLKTVYDPEIPVNVVDLGLVYNVVVTGDDVRVDMTMTIRGCPMHRYMTADAEEKLAKLAGVKSAQVNLVWDPPWNPSMISADGRKALGRG
jgi:metal-sulfur cluster biosynthetic enzyme